MCFHKAFDFHKLMFASSWKQLSVSTVLLCPGGRSRWFNCGSSQGEGTKRREIDRSEKPGQSKQRVKSIHVMGSPLHQAWWKAAGCCRGKWLPETLPSITRQVRPPNPSIRMEEKRGGWGRIILEGGRKQKRRLCKGMSGNRLSTISFSHCLFSSTHLSPSAFLLCSFLVFYETVNPALRNSSCWSKSSPGLNCIINYSTASGLEAHLKTKRERESNSRIGRWGTAVFTPPVGLDFAFFPGICISPPQPPRLTLSVKRWMRGGAWVTSVSGCVTFLRRDGVVWRFNELLKRTQMLVNSLRDGEPSCPALEPEVNDLILFQIEGGTKGSTKEWNRS